jgi:tetratricopeptide (TPR) repeat protein
MYHEAKALCEEHNALVSMLTSDDPGKASASRTLRVATLCTLSRVLSKVKMKKQARLVWGKAQQAADAMEENLSQAATLNELGKAAVEASLRKEARQIWLKAERIIQRPEGEQNKKDAALRELARGQAEAKCWQQAERVISSIEDDIQRAGAWRELGLARANAGLTKLAKEDWLKAERVIYTLENSVGEAGMQDRLAEKDRALHELGRAFAAAAQWDHANHVIVSIEDHHEQAEALCELATQLINEPERERKRAKEVISLIEDRKKQVEMLSKLGCMLVEAQFKLEVEAQFESEAEELWMEIKGLAQTVGDRRQRLWELVQLSEMLAGTPLQEQAVALRKEVEELVDAVKNNGKNDRDLRVLGKILAQAGESERAERVVNTVENQEEKELAFILSEYTVQWLDEQVTGTDYLQQKQEFEALKEEVKALASAGSYEEVLGLVQNHLMRAKTRKEVMQFLSIIKELAPLVKGVGSALLEPDMFYDAFRRVDTFLRGEAIKTR